MSPTSSLSSSSLAGSYGKVIFMRRIASTADNNNTKLNKAHIS